MFILVDVIPMYNPNPVTVPRTISVAGRLFDGYSRQPKHQSVRGVTVQCRGGFSLPKKSALVQLRPKGSTRSMSPRLGPHSPELQARTLGQAPLPRRRSSIRVPMVITISARLEQAEIQRDTTAAPGPILFGAALERPRLGQRGLVDEPPAVVGNDDALALTPGRGAPAPAGAGRRVGPRGRGALVAAVVRRERVGRGVEQRRPQVRGCT